MHAFFILGGLLHATALAVAAFFVMFAASRSVGWLKTIGNVLGVWLFVVAALVLIGSIVAASFGGGQQGYGQPGYGMMGYGMMGYRDAPWMQWRQPLNAQQPEPQPPQSAQPAVPSNK